MKIIQSIRAIMSRPWTFIEGLVKRREELLPLEDDPVGEYLEKKKTGVGLADGETDEVPQETGRTPQSVATSSENKASSANVGVPSQPADGAVGTAAQAAPPSSDSVAVPQASGEQKEVAKAESAAGLAAPVSKVEPQAVASIGQNTEVTNSQTVKPSQENKGKDDDTEKLLEVFKSEDLALDTMGALSTELGEMNVYSLLEESKQIAAKMKLKKVSKQSP